MAQRAAARSSKGICPIPVSRSVWSVKPWAMAGAASARGGAGSGGPGFAGPAGAPVSGAPRLAASGSLWLNS
ncbi:hypothetical protein HMPREF1979_01927 [Actinomyces johnsonii F0542]|uniref:Uncharacterized protein n=1 Tax=Actinomyces johnsonii F0542 TaxID=1321818 RepID=U1RXL4_9ACTO|nr:hypothetical protein HMPREF1979_01927 [Actinomyces johnsonii F0542]